MGVPIFVHVRANFFFVRACACMRVCLWGATQSRAQLDSNADVRVFVAVFVEAAGRADAARACGAGCDGCMCACVHVRHGHVCVPSMAVLPLAVETLFYLSADTKSVAGTTTTMRVVVTCAAGDVCRCVTAGIAVEPRGCPCEEAALAERLAHTRLNVNVRQVLPYDAAGYPTRTMGDFQLREVVTPL